jgi:uncharacterized membrane protein
MLAFSSLDVIALSFFAASWGAYALALETRIGARALNPQMDRYRRKWMERLLSRENRMIDGQVMAALQNGSAFFASTSLIAVGGVLTLLRSSDEFLSLVTALPYSVPTSRTQWEAKTMGLAIIFVYAFFKFAWSYRLFNYLSIFIGSAPLADEQHTHAGKNFVSTASRICADAGRHFNRGQRAFFFALGYLGWFLGPLPLIICTGGILIVMVHRQFGSESLRAINEDVP